MKYLLLLVIKFYQTFIPKRFRGKCLFKESCSNYIFRTVKNEGTVKGLIAFRYRYHNCRPNYYLIKENGKLLMITAKHNVIEEEFLDDRLINAN